LYPDGKTRAIPALHRENDLAKAPGQVAGWLRQVTQPPFIAGPLACIEEKFQFSTSKLEITNKVPIFVPN
jgi:hypothetical protein